MFTMGSLFDGIGGFPLAAVRHGVVPVWASEIEAFPMEVTRIRFPRMVHVGDITKLDGAKLPPVDVICGGSPCQDLSLANGNRAGLAGERSGLFMDQVRIVKEMRKADEQRGIPDHLVRPRYLVWENVPGAFSSSDGSDFQSVIEEIIRIKDGSFSVPRPDTGSWQSAGAAILGTGFSLAWRVLDAQYWGVAQRRRRIFLVADFGGRTAPEVLFKQDSLFGNPPPGRGEGQGAALSAQGSIDDPGGAYLIPEGIQSFHINQRDEVIDLHGISGALLATRNMQMQTFVAEPVLCLNDQGGERMDVSVGVVGTLRAGMSGHQPLVMATQQGGAEIGEGICPTITSAAGTSGNNQPVLLEDHPADVPECFCIAGNVIDRQVQNGGNGLGCQTGISYTLTSSDRHAVFNHQDHSSYREGDCVSTQCARQYKGGTDLICERADREQCEEKRKRIRRLTPLECERLQGFPDYWTLIPGASDSARYKALGNSVAIPCVDFIFRGIAYFLQKIHEEEEG